MGIRLFDEKGQITIHGLNRIRAEAQAKVETGTVELRYERGGPFISRCWFEATINVLSAALNKEEINLMHLFPENNKIGQGTQETDND